PTVGPAVWQKGLPAPPWAYEYQYPIDCLKALFVVPQFTTGFSSGVPITTAITGGSPAFWMGPPQRFLFGVHQFFSFLSATVQAGGTGHAVGDIITLVGASAGAQPIGAPAQLLVSTIGGGGAITAVTVVDVVSSDATQGGSYFRIPTNPQAQASTTGAGINATFNLTFNTGGQTDQRVILTNQEGAILCYVRQITDPNVMDPQFQEAWVCLLAARLVFALNGDKALANMKLQEANLAIGQ